MAEILGRGDVRFKTEAFELDAARRLLLVQGTAVDVEPKPLEVLAQLLTHAGELVTKADLMDSVWAGRVVTESVITRSINRLRTVLGDTTQTLILTVHGYGYRYTGAVTVVRELEPAAPVAMAPERVIDAEPPLRPLWRLRRQLDPASDAWLVEHTKTGERRVMKFAATVPGVAALKRELTILRLLRKALGPREEFVRLLDYNLEAAPYFLEFEYHELGSLRDWLCSPQAKQSALETRLQMLAQATEALAAAHAVGVLHKDIKPGNLLMSRNASGELGLCWTDFGIGTVDREKLDHYQLTLVGMTGSEIDASGGTLTYLAPERIAGAPATIRADIYSLGVILYQVGVGDVGRTFAPGWERDIDDELLREDIAACADIDPERRIGDAAELARRLRTRQQRRETQALERSERARLLAAEQMLERNRQRRSWMRAVIAALAIGASISTWQWRRAQTAEHQARASLDEANAVNDFLNDEIFSSADPYTKGGGQQVTVASVLDAASRKLDRDQHLSAAAAARLGNTLGGSYFDLGLLEQASTRLSRSLARSEKQLGTDAEVTNDLRMHLADVLGELNHWSEAGALYEAVAQAAARLGPRQGQELNQRSRSGRGWLAYLRGHYVESADILEPLVAELLAQPAPRAESLAYSRWNLAETLIELNRFDEARQLADAVTRYFASSVGKDNLLLDWVRQTQVTRLLAEGRSGEALSLAQPISARTREQLSKGHWSAQLADYQLGVADLQLGRFKEAKETLDGAFQARAASFGDRHIATLMLANALANAQLGLNDVDAALPLIRRSAQLSNETFGAAHPRSLSIALTYGNALAAHGDLQGAAKQLADTIIVADGALPPTHRLRAELRLSLARVAQRDQRRSEADRLYADALQLFDAGLGPDHPRTRQVRRAIEQGLLPSIVLVNGSPS